MNLESFALQGAFSDQALAELAIAELLAEEVAQAAYWARYRPAEELDFEEEGDDWDTIDQEYHLDDYDPWDDVTEEEIRALDEGAEEFEERRRLRIALDQEY